MDNVADNSFVELLPPQLTTLYLRSNKLFTDDIIAALPRSLTKLELNSNPNLTDACVPHLPKGLVHLILVSSKTTPACLPQMPPNLRYLCVARSFVTEIQNADLRFFSPSLTYINLTYATALTSEAVELLPEPLLRAKFRHNLPNTLVIELALRHVQACSLPLQKRPKRYFDSSISGMNFGGTPLVLDFPMTKAVFPMWVHSRISDSFIAHLPRTIVEISWERIELGESTCSDLPPGLTSLSLPSTSQFSNASLAALPRTLKRLIIPKCTEITDEGLTKLPTGLEVLDLGLNRNITNKGISMLSCSSLSELYLGTCDKITDAGIGSLPRSLIVLDLSWAKLTEASISKLPPKLVDLNVDGMVVSNRELLKTLPPSLRRLRMRTAEHSF